MFTNTKDEIKVLQFELLKDIKKIRHGVLCRKGGVSTFPYNSLNLNLEPCNNTQDILQNFEKIKQSFHLKDPVLAKQVHQDSINCITPQNRFENFVCDGFITSHPNIPVLIKHADCQATLFYDPIKNVIANVHCGWKGNVINIYKKSSNVRS